MIIFVFTLKLKYLKPERDESVIRGKSLRNKIYLFGKLNLSSKKLKARAQSESEFTCNSA